MSMTRFPDNAIALIEKIADLLSRSNEQSNTIALNHMIDPNVKVNFNESVSVETKADDLNQQFKEVDYDIAALLKTIQNDSIDVATKLYAICPTMFQKETN